MKKLICKIKSKKKYIKNIKYEFIFLMYNYEILYKIVYKILIFGKYDIIKIIGIDNIDLILPEKLYCINKSKASLYFSVPVFNNIAIEKNTLTKYDDHDNYTFILKEVEVQPELVKMISYRDGVYKKIADIELGNSSKQDVELQIKIEDLLSEEEITSLNEGNEVVGNFDYQVQKEVRINSGKMTDKINFGAFRIHFKAVLDETNTIKIKTLK